MRVMMPILATTYGESVTCKNTQKVRHRGASRLSPQTQRPRTWTPYLDRAEPTGPMLKGMTYMVRPADTDGVSVM